MSECGGGLMTTMFYNIRFSGRRRRRRRVVKSLAVAVEVYKYVYIVAWRRCEWNLDTKWILITPCGKREPCTSGGGDGLMVVFQTQRSVYIYIPIYNIYINIYAQAIYTYIYTAASLLSAAPSSFSKHGIRF